MKLLTDSNSKLADIAVLILRLGLGLILAGYGAEKVFGWFGGKGLDATVEGFVTKMGIPAFLAYLSCFTEFVGGLLIAFGLLTRFASLAVTVNMAVATGEVFSKGLLTPGGAAYPLDLMLISIAIFLIGPRLFSFDHIIENRAYPLAPQPKARPVNATNLQRS